MLEEIEETPAEESGRRRAKGKEGATGPVQGQQRQLEGAPQLLRKASVILMVGGLLPWMTALSTGGYVPWKTWFIGMALTIAAGFVLIESAKAASGLKANGLVKPIAGAHALAGPIFGLLLFIGAAVVAFGGEPAIPAKLTAKASEAIAVHPPAFGWRGAVELASLFLAFATFAHILAYEYGGKFNPIFPLMFLGPALAGLLNVFGALPRMGEHPLILVALVGSLVVAVGGFMAMYTMYVSLRQAKVEGDAKREMMRERKKAEREARRSR